jgi:hypothetical protein
VLKVGIRSILNSAKKWISFNTMIKKIKIATQHLNYFVLLMAFLAGAPGPVFCSDYTGHCSVAAGGLATGNKFSSAFNIDRQGEIGLTFDVKKTNWPISIAFDSSFLHAESKISENQYNLEENKKTSFFRSDTSLGIKKIFNLSPVVKPFIGNGLYFVRIYGKYSDDRKMIAGIGYWLGAGVYFDLTKSFTCGFSWKMSRADIKIFNIKSNVGGNHFSLITGFHF